jgi:hypothetical protein
MHITIAGAFRQQLEQSLVSRDPAVPSQSEIANNLRFIGGNARKKHHDE